ncbi:MAG: histidinol-phosphatase [Lachnospiraceae bacterium]|nr:histidinol-phosphatase [Lachnospiraceae bacterium]MBQ6196862.1 histidinol-phosphatase [Lachnospiraceae bacterium]
MIANYHTHTYRCGHAEGNEKDYVQEAVKAGLKILGFSDHTPQDYYDADPGRYPSRVRMKPEELPGYADSIRSLKDEYADRLEIHLGVEAEYYPKYFPRLLEMLRENRIEYMILGQHYLGNEVGDVYSGRETDDPQTLRRYVSQVCEALDTGLFTYLAHPDLIHFVGDARIYESEMRRLCHHAKETGTPLEINLLGMREERHYPTASFWPVAAEEGCEVVIGCDAHQPDKVMDIVSEKAALETVSRLGLKLKETVELRKI